MFSLNDDVSPESIDLYIHRLRKKLTGSGVRITTLRGWATCWSAAMKWVKPQSLYLQLCFSGFAAAAVMGLSAFNSYVSALQAATQAYDRTLLSSARTVSERLVVHNGKLR